MQSTALAKRLRAKDIKAQTGSMVANGCFLNNMLKALTMKQADMCTPDKGTAPTFPREVGGNNRPCTVLEKGQHSDNECDVEIFQEVAVEWNCRRD